MTRSNATATATRSPASARSPSTSPVAPRSPCRPATPTNPGTSTATACRATASARWRDELDSAADSSLACACTEITLPNCAFLRSGAAPLRSAATALPAPRSELSSRQLDVSPGRFPQCAHGHPDALAVLGHGRPEPETAAALVAGESLPVAGHALVLVPGIIDGADLEAGGDHGPRFSRHPRVAGQLDAHQLTLGGDALDHGRGLLQRQPHDQPAMLRSPEPGGSLGDAAAPPASPLIAPAAPAARYTRHQ